MTTTDLESRHAGAWPWLALGEWQEFLHGTYEAGATLAGWDRAALERAGAGG